MKYVRPVLLGVALAASAVVYLGCEIDSANEFRRNLPVNYSGFYSDSDGMLVDRNSGKPIRGLDLRQSGDRLEAVDNNGQIWRGTIGNAGEVGSAFTASFTLEGRNSIGREGLFSGTLSTEVTTTTDTNGNSSSTSSGEGEMRGTYIEDDIFSPFFGTAQNIPGVIPTPDDGGDGGDSNGVENVTIAPSLTELTNNLQTVVFTASGGDGAFAFSVGNGTRGSIINVSDNQATYRRNTAGDNTVTVESAGDTATATILQP